MNRDSKIRIVRKCLGGLGYEARQVKAEEIVEALGEDDSSVSATDVPAADPVNEALTTSNPLIPPGDQLQSAASRLAEWVIEQPRWAPYEVRMAALEARSAIEAWTEVRKTTRGDSKCMARAHNPCLPGATPGPAPTAGVRSLTARSEPGSQNQDSSKS